MTFAITDNNKFKILFRTKGMTNSRLANIFGCHEDTIRRTVRRLGLPTKIKNQDMVIWKCENTSGEPVCPMFEWCQANPYAEQLPCEVEATPHTDHWREINVYPSMNGFWRDEANRRSMD